MSFHANIAECGACEYRQRPCAGPCPCKLTRCDSSAHARHNYCPKKKFGDGVKPEGWKDDPIAAFNARPALMSDDEIKATLQAGDPGGCNCGGEDRTSSE